MLRYPTESITASILSPCAMSVAARRTRTPAIYRCGVWPNQTQTNNIADFMRAVNTLQNIDVARRELKEIAAVRDNRRKEVDTRLQSAFEDTQDAIDVLNERSLFPAAVTRLTTAREV